MIVEFADLHRLRNKVAMVDGCFDPLHAGHLAYFRAASELGLPVLCNIADDAYLATKHAALLPADQRATIIDSVRYITYTHVSRVSTTDVLRELQPRMYVKGEDWHGRLPQEQLALAEQFGIEVVLVPTVYHSSTAILSQFMTHAADAARFEAHVFEQQPTSALTYDTAYFTDEWREGGNSYRLETRREIEGRNPALIKEVFQPRHVLDLGCGPGALLHLLYELGVHAEGVDFSPHSRDLAPSTVRDRITIGPVTQQLFEDDSFDLIICRELIEHLTLLETRQVIHNMARMSSRYIYVTTRFHPAPTSILDVTDERDVDPTHITLMTKDLLRVLLTLEGFKSRPDLEQKMDWLNKGRVLVYEKQQPAFGQ